MHLSEFQAKCRCQDIPTELGAILRSLGRLSSLNLSGSSYPKGITADFLPGLSALRRLVLARCRLLTSSTLNIVSTLVDLQHLDLDNVRVRLPE